MHNFLATHQAALAGVSASRASTKQTERLTNDDSAELARGYDVIVTLGKFVDTAVKLEGLKLDNDVASIRQLEKRLDELNASIRAQNNVAIREERDRMRQELLLDAHEFVALFRRDDALLRTLCGLRDSLLARTTEDEQKAATAGVLDGGIDARSKSGNAKATSSSNGSNNNGDEPMSVREFVATLHDVNERIDTWCSECAALTETHTRELRTVAKRAGERLRGIDTFLQAAAASPTDARAAQSLFVAYVNDIEELAHLAAALHSSVTTKLGRPPIGAAAALVVRCTRVCEANVAGCRADAERIDAWLRDWSLRGNGGVCPTDERHRQLVAQHLAAKKRLMLARHALEVAELDGDADELARRRGAQHRAQAEVRVAASEVEREALALTILAATHYPELRHLYPTVCIDVDASECLARDLDCYDDVVALRSTGNHRIYRAKYNGHACVLKDFDLFDARDRGLFMNEAKRLRALQHPCIVEVQAVFVSSSKLPGAAKAVGVIQMPYYDGGDLSQWIESEQRQQRGDRERQLVLRSVLLGLAYVHSKGIVHGDVKPANIFLRQDGSAVLGDFDRSRDAATLSMNATRTTTGGGSSSAGVGGAGTWDYMAPELLLSASPASAASDMYAFGLTAFDLHFVPRLTATSGWTYQRPKLNEQLSTRKAISLPRYANEAVAAPLHAMLESLLAFEPSRRATAEATQVLGYFQLQLLVNRAPADKRVCSISMDECWLDEGIECANRHFLCDDSLDALVLSLSKESVGKHSGKVKCPTVGCAEQFDAQLVARHVKSNTFKAFMLMQKSALELEMERDFAVRLKAELTRAEQTKGIAEHRKHIVDSLLTLRCPRCAQAFVDFSGCFALTCSRCRAGFCAWCLTDCGSDAHAHVARCPRSVGGGPFGTLAQFQECHRKRCGELVRAYLAALPGTIDKSALVAACKQDFADLQLQI